MLNRRSLLAAGGASTALAALGIPPDALAQGAVKLGQPQPFSYERLVAQAKEAAGKPFVAGKSLPSDVLDKIDYEALGKINYDTKSALFRDGPGPFPVTFFHMGRFSQVPVQMFVNESANGQTRAREVVYDSSLFDMPADSPARKMPDGAGFAGFRVQESRLGDQQKLPWQKNDWAAFLGASYFRAIGELYQYGLSARGVALDAAVAGKPEEFPNFTRFWLEPSSAPNADTITVYAWLEGPSITGAFKFLMTRGKAVLMDIEASLFLRQDVQRFGLVPLTSMFWYGETTKPTAIDWRPEVHDSDGLAMWTGTGERIWRPLNNPQQVRASAFGDKSPKGFGLLQRDRNFDHFQDGVFYEKRPSLWVEPQGDWGAGSVQLVEIPTDDEIHDNILACWVPNAPAKAGSAYTLKYRLHWAADEPFPTPLARCVATRIGRGGQPGTPRPAGVRKFMVEFLGKPLEAVPFGVKPELVLTASRGSFSYVFSEAVPDGIPGHWRAQFDFTPGEGGEPVDMRLFMKTGEQTLTETWLYQYLPGT